MHDDTRRQNRGREGRKTEAKRHPTAPLITHQRLENTSYTEERLNLQSKTPMWECHRQQLQSHGLTAGDFPEGFASPNSKLLLLQIARARSLPAVSGRAAARDDRDDAEQSQSSARSGWWRTRCRASRSHQIASKTLGFAYQMRSPLAFSPRDTIFLYVAACVRKYCTSTRAPDETSPRRRWPRRGVEPFLCSQNRQRGVENLAEGRGRIPLPTAPSRSVSPRPREARGARHRTHAERKLTTGKKA